MKNEIRDRKEGHARYRVVDYISSIRADGSFGVPIVENVSGDLAPLVSRLLSPAVTAYN